MTSRRCMVLTAVALMVGPALACASPTMARSPMALKTKEFKVPALDPGIELYVRNKVPTDLSEFTAKKTVLFVHGATYPSEVTFDLSVGGTSWMEYIARRGYDVYLLDIRGYGRSTRPAEMAQPSEQNAPLVHTEEAARDIEAAVTFILGRRNLTALNLIGWSWGTTTTALYATRHQDKVEKIVLYAPIWTPPTVGAGPAPPTTAYRTVSVEDARQRWYTGVPADKQAALIPEGWFDTWARALLESDPDSARQDPPLVRAPNGVLDDIRGQWLQGIRLYEAAEIVVPTLIVKGEWDADTPASMAQGLFQNLTKVPYKSYTEIGEATHTLMLEKNRWQLFRAVQAFLDESPSWAESDLLSEQSTASPVFNN